MTLTRPGGVAQNFAALGAGEILSRIIAFLATVYLARTLGAGVYGVVAFAGAVLLYAGHLADAGIDTLGVPIVARAPARAGELLTSLSLARLAAALLVALLLAAAGLTVLPQPEGAILAAFAFVLPVRALTARWALLGLDQPRVVAAGRVAGEALCAVLVVTLVRGSGDLSRVPLTQLAGDAVTALVFLAALRRLGHVGPARYRHDVALPVLRDSWQLVANALLAMIVFNFDLIALRFFRDSTAVGWYSSGYALVSFLSNLGVTFAYSVLPALARLGTGQPGERALYQLSLSVSAALTLPLAVGGALLAPGLIMLVYGAGFEPAAAPLALLLVSVPLTWIRLVCQMALVSRGLQREVLAATAIGSAAAVVLDLALIPRYGMLGAAAATVAAEVLRTVLLQRTATRAGLDMPGPARFWRAALAALVMAVAVWMARELPVLAAVGVGAVVYAAVMLLAGAVRLRPFALRL